MKTTHFSIAIFLLFTVTGIKSYAKKRQRPNVIIVVADDMGLGDMGCYGNKIIQTPHMDSFFEDAVRLNDFHVSPTCAPSRSSFMTGKYCHHVGVHATIEGREMPFAHEQMMPEVFVQNGYKTAMFGKWHLGDAYPFRPEDRGFEHVVCHHGGGITQTPDYWGNDYFNDTYWVNGQLQKFEGYCTDVWFDEASAFIQQSKKDKKPFFAYIATNAPHAPFRTPQKYLDLYNPKHTPPPFYGMITNIDDNFGKLLALLKSEGIEDNTIVILTSDNGSNIGTYYFDAGMRGKKGTVYEGGHRVPFFIRWAQGGLVGGKDIQGVTAHIDILPTFVDLLGFKDTKVDYSGFSIKDALYGDEKAIKNRSLVVSSWSLEEWDATAVLQGKWRLIDNEKLYNIEKDPMQHTNVIWDHPTVVDSLRAIYRTYRQKVQEDPTAYFVIGTPQQNPMPFNAHDLRIKRDENHTQPPVGQGVVLAKVKNVNAPWMVHIAKAGNYEVSIRRFPAELDQGINQLYTSPTSGWTGGALLKADKAYIELAGVKKEINVPKGAKEVTFKLKLPKKDSAAFRAGFIMEGKKHAAHYAYVLNADIYKGNLACWQTPKAMGLPLASADSRDVPNCKLIDPRTDPVKYRRLPVYLPKEGATVNDDSDFAWTTSTSNLEGAAVHYFLEIASDKQFLNVLAQKDHIKTQSITLEQLTLLDKLPKDKDLYVRITAFNAWGKKTEPSEAVSFRYK